MDPPLIINESSCYSAANPSYSLAELWPFPIAGGGGGGGGEGEGKGKEGGPFGPPMPCLTASELDPTPASSALSVDQESTLTHQSPCPKRKYFLNSEPDSSNPVLSATTPAHLNDANAKRIKASGGGRGVREENDDSKAEAEAETSSQTSNKPSDHQNTKNEPPKDYIHVRARRGQATDSHSLAERARREKISERMKILQDLVPGCNKVIGKALVLDEIINYIQSLQHQVEFLSMKLEAVNSRMNPAIEGFPCKDLAGPPFDAAAMIFGQQAAGEYAQVAQAEWLHMQVGSNFERAT